MSAAHDDECARPDFRRASRGGAGGCRGARLASWHCCRACRGGAGGGRRSVSNRLPDGDQLDRRRPRRRESATLSASGGRISPMPPRRRAPAPIPVDIEGVRRKLAEGKIVRVGISKSAQFPDGATGRVRHVGDPAVDGEEFVQVELSLNGMRDILPFTPADLTPATRGRPPGSSDAAAGARAARGSRAAGPRRESVSRTPGPGPAKPARTLTSVPTGDMLPDSPARQSGAAARDTGVADSAAAGPAGATTPADAATQAAQSLPTTATVPGGPTAEMTPQHPVARQQRPAAGSHRAALLPIHGARLNSRPTSGKSKQHAGPRRTPAVTITIATTDTEPTLVENRGPGWRPGCASFRIGCSRPCLGTRPAAGERGIDESGRQHPRRPTQGCAGAGGCARRRIGSGSGGIGCAA